MFLRLNATKLLRLGGGVGRGEVLPRELEHVCRHLHEGRGDKVVDNLLDLGVPLQVLGVLTSDGVLRGGTQNGEQGCGWLRRLRQESVVPAPRVAPQRRPRAKP